MAISDDFSTFGGLIGIIMSIKTESIATCSRCGNRTGLTMYKSINTAEDPSLKEKVKDGSLFLWKCPSCGQANLAKYDTLYHDPGKKMMVWLLQDENVSETQMHSISLHAKAIGNYTLRRVTDTGSLMEKVLIFDSGLDDVTVELCKYVLKMELASKSSDEEAAKRILQMQLHFFRLDRSGDSKSITFVYPEEGQMKNYTIGYNVYEDCCGILQRNTGIKPDEGFAKVDSEWLSGYFR